MTYLPDLLFILQYLINSFDYYEIRLAVSSLLGEGNFGTNAAEVFEYLLRSYISFLIKHNNYAVKYNGFMEKATKEIHSDTLVSLTPIKSIVKSLSDNKLIDLKRGGLNNSYIIRINENCIVILYESLKKLYDSNGKKFDKSINNDISDVINSITASKKICDEEYIARKAEEKQKKKEEKEKKNGFIPFNRDYKDVDLTVNEAMYDTEKIGEVFSVVKDADERKASCTLVYLFSYYYKLYTGNDYEWDYLKYDIMMKAVKDYYKYPNIEICISLSLRKVLNIKETDLGGKIKMEKLFSEKYNHDYNYHHLNNYAANKDGYQGYKFDNILGIEEYYPSYYYEEQKPSFVIEMNESMPKRLALFDWLFELKIYTKRR